MKITKHLVLLLILVFSTLLSAQTLPDPEPLVFETPEQEERYKTLTFELRCTVCQNQNLADSDATLAHDLKRKVHEMILAGNTNEEIKAYMVERYGDFVLYRPPVQKNTYLLWLAPLIMLLGGGLILIASIRKRSSLYKESEAAQGEDPNL
jgi:cytochrome c-type biogenesis protein CcmH